MISTCVNFWLQVYLFCHHCLVQACHAYWLMLSSVDWLQPQPGLVHFSNQSLFCVSDEAYVISNSCCVGWLVNGKRERVNKSCCSFILLLQFRFFVAEVESEILFQLAENVSSCLNKYFKSFNVTKWPRVQFAPMLTISYALCLKRKRLLQINQTLSLWMTLWSVADAWLHIEQHINCGWSSFNLMSCLLYFLLQSEDTEQQIIRETFHLVSKRDENVCNFLEGGMWVYTTVPSFVYFCAFMCVCVCVCVCV